MASRISQMRNGQQPYPQTQQQQQQQALSESIERTKALMQQFQNSSNPQAALMNIIKQTPELGQLANILRNGNSLEGIARQMARASNLDINEIIKGLQGGNTL